MTNKELALDLQNYSEKQIFQAINARYEALEKKKHLFFDHYQPNEKQLLFHSLGKLARFRLLLGTNRGGKTYCGLREIGMDGTGNYAPWWNGYVYEYAPNIWACGMTSEKTYETLFIPLIMGDGNKPPLIHPDLIVRDRCRVKDNKYAIRHSSGGISYITFKNYSQSSMTFESSGVDKIYFDEAAPQAHTTAAIARLVQTEAGQRRMYLNTQTPTVGITEPLGFFLYKTITNESGDIVQVNREPNVVDDYRVHIYYDIEEATHMSREEKDFFINSLPVYEREARTKGIPSVGSGLVYPILESSFRVEPREIPEYWPRVMALDFGGTSSHTAALFCAFDLDNRKAYIYGEHYTLGLTPQHNASQLIERGANWIPVIYDTSGEITSLTDGEKVANLYKEAGVRNMHRADRSKEPGLQTVLQAFQNYEIKVFSTCSNFFSEIRTYAKGEDGRAKKGNDHLMDCLRYIFMDNKGKKLAKAASNKSWSKYYDRYKDIRA